MVNEDKFAKRLQKVLEYYQLSATAFAQELNFNRSTISHLLTGRNKPSLEFVMKVLQKFPEVELYWLLNGKGTFPHQAPSPSAKKEVVVEVNEINEESFIEEKQVSSNSEIDQIIIFYKDGSFKRFKN